MSQTTPVSNSIIYPTALTKDIQDFVAKQTIVSPIPNEFDYNEIYKNHIQHAQDLFDAFKIIIGGVAEIKRKSDKWVADEEAAEEAAKEEAERADLAEEDGSGAGTTNKNPKQRTNPQNRGLPGRGGIR